MMKTFYIAAMVLILSSTGWAQRSNVNYDESKVPVYTLPALLETEDGLEVTNVAQWEQQRRREILELFAAQVYGRTPTDPIAVRYDVLTENPQALGGQSNE